MASGEFEDSFALFDAAHKLVDWDAGFEREWLFAAPYLRPGISYSEILSTMVADPKARELISNNLISGKIETYFAERARALGEERLFDYTIGALTVEVREHKTLSGGVLRVARNVTAERQAETALTSAEQELRAADAGPDSIRTEARRNPDGSYVFPPVSEAMQRFLALSPDVVDGDPMQIYGRFLTTNEENERRRDIMEHSARTLEICTYEYRIRDGHDNIRWIRQSMMPRREADGTVIFTGSMRDITREKSAEDQVELLRSVVVRSGDAIIILESETEPGQDTRILYVNRKFEEIYETVADAVVGKSSRVLQTTPMSRKNSRALSRSLRRGDGVPIEFEAVSPSGRHFWVEARAETVQRLNNNAFRWVVISRDITERRNVQLQLMRAKEAAEAGNRAKSNFLANMSHELRTPLNAIIGFAELVDHGIGRTGWKDQYREYFGDIIGSGRHLLDLINTILDLSKIEAGSLSLEIEEVDLCALVRGSLDLVQGMASRTGVKLNCSLGNEPVLINADPIKIRQVMLNLLSNAVKFTPPNGIVSTDLAATADAIEVTITDTGCGISPADLDRVMQPFVQVDNSLSRRFDGSGLGLPIARELCILHGGSLIIESEEGKGTTARVRLPYRPPNA